MKTFTKAILPLLFFVVTNNAFSQKSDELKKAVFSAYPEKMEVAPAVFENALTTKSGENINIKFNEQFQFSGTVLCNQEKYWNLQTMIIRSTAFENSLFQLSRLINDDKSISYVGRIINPNTTDGFTIRKDGATNYHLQKIEMNKILQDCSY
jgi:hypothetical protein